MIEQRGVMPTITIRIPTPLRSFTRGRDRVAVHATTVREAIEAVAGGSTGFRERILTQDGRLQRFVNLYVERDDVAEVGGLDAALATDATISVVLALAGG
jgi:molybdopterin converting factor small subunit